MNDLKFREDDHAVRPAKSFALDRSNGKLMGVCSGITRYFGSFILIYLAIALIAD